MKTVRVAVAGLGVVGSETVRLLRSRRESLARRLNAKLELVAVCDRAIHSKARGLRLPAKIKRFSDPSRLAACGADIIVELLGGLPAPRSLVLDCLRRGRHVVTANKRLLAHCWPELRRAQSHGSLHFEASVAGGIPILKALDLSLAGDRIEAVGGILNGTTNFILTRMSEGLGASAALKKAQELGLAESDPSRDLNGQDAADKVSVLASLVTGSWQKPDRIETQGIEGIESQDIAFAQSVLGRRIKLLGMVRLKDRGVEALVCPFLVPLAHPLAAVRDEFNAVLVQAASAGELMFYGRGAGAGPAASAVMGDICVAARDILSGVRAEAAADRHAEARPASSPWSFYLRLAALDRPGVLSSVASVLGRRGISISTIHQPGATGSRSVPIIITTHPTSAEDFCRAKREILALSSVSRQHMIMRLLP
ncbi:MAG TPA: homoserine dehydrogenase [Elusimicrobia bacterium]|nr:homoserine dehydrogenase [Elusimicrobiota bacterium]HBT61536.1 homoserine dehydrogenase [Elusimicrobiota bacterium]